MNNITDECAREILKHTKISLMCAIHTKKPLNRIAEDLLLNIKSALSHQNKVSDAGSCVWVNGKYFKDDWDDFGFFHWRYADDHLKLDTDLFENRDGALHKINGEGIAEYYEIEFLYESIPKDKPIEPIVSDAVEFAEWLHLNKYKVYQSPKGCMWKNVVYDDMTTQELYEKFKSEKPQITSTK